MTAREWANRLWGTLRRARSDRDLEDELRAQLALAADEERRRGNSDCDAVRTARLRVGGVAQAMAAQFTAGTGHARMKSLRSSNTLHKEVLKAFPGVGVATSRSSCGLVAARFPCRVYNRAAICAVSILSLMIAAAVHVPCD